MSFVSLVDSSDSTVFIQLLSNNQSYTLEQQEILQRRCAVACEELVQQIDAEMGLITPLYNQHIAICAKIVDDCIFDAFVRAETQQRMRTLDRIYKGRSPTKSKTSVCLNSRIYALVNRVQSPKNKKQDIMFSGFNTAPMTIEIPTKASTYSVSARQQKDLSVRMLNSPRVRSSSMMATTDLALRPHSENAEINIPTIRHQNAEGNKLPPSRSSKLASICSKARRAHTNHQNAIDF
ncbi:hypothetical protein SS50377_24253 [Spironucleus salmonicida]|uniref:Uncharacterized protein n=1 Tax=Spironucleus salmonicida TaxID=348837 RepID=V6LVQ3_9EUKA|nr:hypothetical protein SS50377_24253 [Spironucleus salmonicida]|eukprot:EST48702.1 Hypothetical protein SS50377_11112 [Spironucleus salmonicida]